MRMHNDIREALDLDPSNITGYFLLDALSEKYFGHRSFSVSELIGNPERTAEYLAKTTEFNSLVKSKEVVEIGNHFKFSESIAFYIF